MPERSPYGNAMSFNELGLEYKSMEIGKVPFFVKMTEKNLVARASKAHETVLPNGRGGITELGWNFEF
jgi:hypothetical protein